METAASKSVMENYGVVENDYNGCHKNSWTEDQPQMELQGTHGIEQTSKTSRLHSVVEAACR